MAWDFSTEPEFQEKLDWMKEFVATEIEPMDLVFRHPAAPFDPNSPAQRAMAPLKKIVKEKKLWACQSLAVRAMARLNLA
jgi:acyl-CoA dehydrogenase